MEAVEQFEHVDNVFASKGIKIEDILELQERNPDLTLEEMGNILGCSAQNVHTRLNDYKPVVQKLERFRKHEGKVLATIRKKVTDTLQSFEEDDLKKVNPRDLTVMYGVLYDKGRLEEGKSTSNISLADAALRLSESLEGIDEELKKMGG